MRVLWLAGLAACGATVDVDNSPDAAPPIVVDAPVDAVIPLGPWSAPVPVGIVAVADDDPTATGDLLELYFNRAQDIFVVTRASTSDPWGTPVVVAELSSADNDTTPEVSYDGLSFYLASNRPGGLGGQDIWRSSRANRQAAWSIPVHVPELSTTSTEAAPATTTDQLVMVFESNRAGVANDVFMSTRGSTAMPWGAPVAIAPVNDAMTADGNPMLTVDQLEMYLDSQRSGDSELYLAARTSVTDPFGAPILITEFSSPASAESDQWISPDRRTMYFTSTRDGTTRLWQSTR